jgi:Domain of unknown function (DUF4271)
MASGIKNLFFILLSWILLCSFTQADTVSRRVDSALAMLDSTIKKDTLYIQYVPVIPKSFQIADANHFSFLHGSIIDSNYNPLKDYKQYFAQKKNAFKLYNQLVAKSNDSALIFRIEQRFSLPDKDFLFYSILGLLFLFAFVHNIYPQYFPKLFSQFNQSSLRMLQNREQLLQNSLASLLMNIGFILSFSLMATLLIFSRHLLPLSFWEGYLYIALFFTSLYLGKYLFLLLAGYTFNSMELIQTYVFVIFMINKVLGILLVPFILILAFAKPQFYPIAIVGGAVLSVLLILYRYLFSLTTVRNKLHISSFHFFLYLCAFEIVPILILYKLVVQYFGGTY